MTSGSAASAVAAGLAAEFGGTSASADPAHQVRVVLTGADGPSMIPLIKVIRGLTGFALKQAKDLATAGGLVQQTDPASAARAVRLLEGAGGRVRVDAAGGPAPGPGGLARPRHRTRSTARPVLAPAGPQVRPNGTTYMPRELGGLEDVALLRAARGRRQAVFLYGPPGTGKTALAEAAFAGADGAGMETIGCTAETTEDDFVGTFTQDPATGVFSWVPGPLHRSLISDVPLFVDEIALADSGVLPVLYSLMDGRGVLHITRNPALDPISVGPGWYVIAACNPDVPGASMSDALLSRFTHHIEVTTDWDLAADLGVPAPVITIARNLDARRRDDLLTWSPQMRELLDFADLAGQYGPDYAAGNLAGKAPAADRAAITDALRTSYPRVRPLSLGARFGA